MKRKERKREEWRVCTKLFLRMDLLDGSNGNDLSLQRAYVVQRLGNGSCHGGVSLARCTGWLSSYVEEGRKSVRRKPVVVFVCPSFLFLLLGFSSLESP